MGKKKTTNKKGQKDYADDLMKAMDAEIAQAKAEDKANDKKFLMVLCGGALLWLSYLLLWWSSGLWLGKNGFWWGALVFIMIGILHFACEISGILVFGGFEKAWKYKTTSREVGWLVCMYCGSMIYVGWEFMRIGWCHWWTGVMPSLIFGPCMIVGLRLFITGCLNTTVIVRRP